MKRSNTPAIQILQDFGIMKLDDILQVEANYLGTEVVSLRDREISPDLLKTIPANVARMYRCMPVGVRMATRCRSRWPSRSTRRAPMKSHFTAKRDVQIVVADPGRD